MIAPFMMIFILFTVFPVVLSLVISFTSFNMTTLPRFIWMDNYIRLFLDDDLFVTAAKNTLIFSSLVASETGTATTYGLYQSQDRGPLFIGPATPVYEGMIVGENPKPDDIEVNVCREKHLTAIRSSGADEKLTLITPRQLSLEEAIEFITEDELIEVTPKSIRLRKVILDTPQRKRIAAQKRAALKEHIEILDFYPKILYLCILHLCCLIDRQCKMLFNLIIENI